MGFVRLVLQSIFIGLGSVTALLSIILFRQLRWPAPVLWILKLYVSAFSPWLALAGILTAIAGLATGSVFTGCIGIYGAIIFLVHIYRITRPPGVSDGFENAFGLNWKNRVSDIQKRHFIKRRTQLKLPPVSNPRMEQNISFATIPATDRKLLCDIWQPPSSVASSGLAFIYLQGGAWYMLDKDLGTRPFFTHLASQGHVIMDVAYRHAPETDMKGMIGDVKRAIAWLKEHAHAYGINPDRIVVGGGSSGGHLALMAAYTANNSQFTPIEIKGIDVSVCGVISLYGPTDLEAMYYHTSQHLTTRSAPGRPKKAVPTQMPRWIKNKMGADYHRLGFDKGFENAGAFAPLLGGHPDEHPELYDLYSPVKYVHSHCPPTLLIHGEHDVMAPVNSTRQLHALLTEQKAPSVLHIFPQTDHAFDLVKPDISPSAHNAIFDVERFLAFISGNQVNKILPITTGASVSLK